MHVGKRKPHTRARARAREFLHVSRRAGTLLVRIMRVWIVRVSVLLTVAALSLNGYLLMSRAEALMQLESTAAQLRQMLEASEHRERRRANPSRDRPRRFRADNHQLQKLLVNEQLLSARGSLTDPAESPQLGAFTGAPPQSSRPIANVAATVNIGNRTRITVLTEGLLRIEHVPAAGGFDDRRSFTVVNRRLAVPSYEARVGACRLLSKSSRCLVLSTLLLTLELAAPNNAKGPRRLSSGGWQCDWVAATPTAANTQVELRLHRDSEEVGSWWPGKPNPRQLPGTLRTLDKTSGRQRELRCDHLPAESKVGATEDQHCGMHAHGVDLPASARASLSRRSQGKRACARVVPATSLTPPRPSCSSLQLWASSLAMAGCSSMTPAPHASMVLLTVVAGTGLRPWTWPRRRRRWL